MKKILITGSEGLIGNKIRRELLSENFDIIGMDIKKSTLGSKGIEGNILDKNLLITLVNKCDGIIHLAAVSRVIDGQKNPELCNKVNITGTANVISAAQKAPGNPWIIYASSREVYGNAKNLPVTEDDPLKPMNVYGRTKVISEENIQNHIELGGKGAIIRFSNVYGDVTYDHKDRVVPAFAYSAAMGKTLRIEGKNNSFDFTHLKDTCQGILKVVKKLEDNNKSLPPIHFVTGKETNLMQLAQLAILQCNSTSSIIEAPSRDYDVSRFFGSNKRAKSLLDWEPKIFLAQGVLDLIKDFLDIELKKSPNHLFRKA